MAVAVAAVSLWCDATAAYAGVQTVRTTLNDACLACARVAVSGASAVVTHRDSGDGRSASGGGGGGGGVVAATVSDRRSGDDGGGSGGHGRVVFVLCERQPHNDTHDTSSGHERGQRAETGSGSGGGGGCASLWCEAIAACARRGDSVHHCQ